MTRRGRRDLERTVRDLETSSDRADRDAGEGLTEKQLRHIREMCEDAPP